MTVPYGDKKRGYRPGFSADIFPGKIGQEVERITSQIVTRFCKYRNIKLKNLFVFLIVLCGKMLKKEFLEKIKEFEQYLNLIMLL